MPEQDDDPKPDIRDTLARLRDSVDCEPVPPRLAHLARLLEQALAQAGRKDGG